MKTTEELRKEVERLKEMDFSYKIKPLEEQLKAAEKGELIFQDAQIQSKIDYLNDLLSREGIPLCVARTLDFIYFDEVVTLNHYTSLSLMYIEHSEILQRIYDFKPCKNGSELFEQLSYIEQHLDVLNVVCSFPRRHKLSPKFKGFYGGKTCFSYFDFDIVIESMDTQDAYSVLVSTFTNKTVGGGSVLNLNHFEVVAQIEPSERVKLKIYSSEDGVKSSDLILVIDKLIDNLVDFIKDETPFSLTLD